MFGKNQGNGYMNPRAEKTHQTDDRHHSSIIEYPQKYWNFEANTDFFYDSTLNRAKFLTKPTTSDDNGCDRAS